jgi:hypothetical protein
MQSAGLREVVLSVMLGSRVEVEVEGRGGRRVRSSSSFSCSCEGATTSELSTPPSWRDGVRTMGIVASMTGWNGTISTLDRSHPLYAGGGASTSNVAAAFSRGNNSRRPSLRGRYAVLPLSSSYRLPNFLHHQLRCIFFLNVLLPKHIEQCHFLEAKLGVHHPP